MKKKTFLLLLEKWTNYPADNLLFTDVSCWSTSCVKTHA